MSRRLLAALAVVVAVPFAARNAAGQDAEAEREPLPFVALVGDGSAPRPDDVLLAGGWNPRLMFRGVEGEPRLRFEGPRAFEVGADGSETMVYLQVSGGTVSAGLLPLEDALKIPKADLGRLRGIHFDGWRPEFAPLLAAVRPERCFVDVEMGVLNTLPAFPAGLRGLRIEGFLDAPVDLGGLAGQRDLRMLIVCRANVRDWSPLAGPSELVWLEAVILPDTVASVPPLPHLRRYEARFEDEVTEVSFLERFPALREAILYGTGVTDLKVLERLPHLEVLDATHAPVTRLPAVTLPALRTARLLGHRLASEDLRAFLDANPQCATLHSWKALLHAETGGLDRLRLRTGGTCHRNVAEERTLFETDDADEIRAFLATIAVDDPASRGHCSCCGGPTIELSRGGELAMVLSVHHGQLLRWGGWPGDARLTPDSADALCDWLSAHGAPSESPRQGEARRAREDREREAAQDVLLGRERGAAVRAADDAGVFAETIRRAEPDDRKRTVLLLRLARLADGNDGSPGQRVTERARKMLEGEPALAPVLLALLTDEDVADEQRRMAAGAVYRLDSDSSPLTAEDLARLRVPAARVFIAQGTSSALDSAERLLREQDDDEARALVPALLPPRDATGRPLATPDPEDLYRACEIATWCAETDLPYLRALAAASRSPESWTKQLEWYIGRRK